MNSADIPSDQSPSLDPVRAYLLQLELALESCDPALRHDALIDAEVHLRASIAAGTSPAQAIAEYGSPEEIATAYRSIPTTGGSLRSAISASAASAGSRSETVASAVDREASVSAATSADTSATTSATTSAAASAAAAHSDHGAASSRWKSLRRIPLVGVWFHPIAWRSLAYFGIIGFPLALAYFVWVVTVGTIALGMLPILIGLPLLVFLLGSARALSLFEGKVVELFLGVRMPRRTQPVVGIGEGASQVGFWSRILCWLRDIRSWLSLGYLVGNFPISLAAFTATLTLSVMGLVLVGMPILDLFGLPIGVAEMDDSTRIHFLFTEVKPDADGKLWLPPGAAIPSFLLGFCFLTATLWLVRGMGWVYAHVVQAIQVARPRPAAPTR
ncbi:MAG: sensor domain-containing protein [Limnohabitans sp.]|nr:sensor domain-containing protein [Limnohabitans sp.]